MSIENVFWGPPRIRGELRKLGFAVAQSTIARYMARPDGRAPPSGQRWGTFVRNHMPQIAAMDLFVVSTLGSNLLYVLIIVRLARRELIWINVTSHPTAEWIAQQITEAFPWGEATPRYLIRDRDAVYGAAVTRRLRAMGIRDKPIAPGSPWQNGFAERMIGTIRRECVDHVIALGERHFRRILKSYAANLAFRHTQVASQNVFHMHISVLCAQSSMARRLFDNNAWTGEECPIRFVAWSLATMSKVFRSSYRMARRRSCTSTPRTRSGTQPTCSDRLGRRRPLSLGRWKQPRDRAANCPRPAAQSFA